MWKTENLHLEETQGIEKGETFCCRQMQSQGHDGVSTEWPAASFLFFQLSSTPPIKQRPNNNCLVQTEGKPAKFVQKITGSNQPNEFKKSRWLQSSLTTLPLKDKELVYCREGNTIVAWLSCVFGCCYFLWTMVPQLKSHSSNRQKALQSGQ